MKAMTMVKSESVEKSKGLLAIVKDLLNEPMPKGVNWPQTLGSALLALIVVQILTGALLSLYYSPNADAAYESIQYIETQVLFGKLIRGIHYFAASGMVIVLFAHICRTFFYGAYKRPRQWTWIFGVGLLLITLGFAFTGYLLPWDMKSYFATKVGINIAGVVPVIGPFIIKIMQGGSEMSTITLSRFFALHVIVLPLLLVMLVGGHLFYLRLHGPTPPWVKAGEPVSYPNRFYPQQLFRDSVIAFLVVAVIVILAAKYGAHLEPKADANDTSYIPRPDWYFYSLFQILKIFEGKLEIVGAVILPGAFFTLMLLLPFIDRNPERQWSQRPLAVSAGSAIVLAILILTTWGAYDANQAKQRLQARAEAAIPSSAVADIKTGDPQRGEALYSALKCGECHKDLSQGLNIPPGLEFAGNKYNETWLTSYLLQPYRIRWSAKDQRPLIRMPDFDLTDQEARDLTAFLMQNRIDPKFPEPEFDWAEADSDMVLSGHDLIFEYGCVGCHKVGDEGQNIGPDLTRVGSKLLDAYLYHA
ncbi:MAG TPA: cytochrome b N-terminal domain-containing protein, partial [bacterium]